MKRKLSNRASHEPLECLNGHPTKIRKRGSKLVAILRSLAARGNSAAVKALNRDPTAVAETSFNSKTSCVPSLVSTPTSACDGLHEKTFFDNYRIPTIYESMIYQTGEASPNVATVKITAAAKYSLAPIHESETFQIEEARPTVATVERAAAAKIFLETYFGEVLNGKPTPRSLRRRLLEDDLYRFSKYITPNDAERCRRQFYNTESAYLRETRVLRAKGTRSRDNLGKDDSGKHKLSVNITTNRASTADDYEVVRNLGKGSYGVVRLVRAKDEANSNCSRKSVYAMKVIRKSAIVRTNQESHLRAERDFLVASEGAKW